MNERAEQLITDAGERVLEYLEATEGFAVEQAPMLAQEIVAWGVWGHGAYAAFSFLLAWVAAYVGWRCVRAYRASDDIMADEWSGLLGAVISLPITALTLAGLINAHIALKALVAPRLYIIEQIGGLL